MIIENKKIKMHEDAYIRGVRSYSVASLGDPKAPVPENIFVCKQEKPANAAWEMYMTLCMPSPFNFATWTPSEKYISQNLKQKISKRMQQDPVFFQAVDVMMRDSDYAPNALSVLKRQFEHHARSLDKYDRSLLEEWAQATVSIFDEFTKGLQNVKLWWIYENRVGYAPRTEGYNFLDLHVDGEGLEESYTSMAGPDGTNVFMRHYIKGIWSQNDVGTFVADNQDIEFPNPSDQTNFKFTNNSPILYAAAPWS